MKGRTLYQLEHRCSTLLNLIVETEEMKQTTMEQQKRKSENPISDITNKRMKYETIDGFN